MFKVGITGCGHGNLDIIYQRAIAEKVDLLIIGGDFQAFRNKSDFSSTSIKPKYQRLGDFAAYYHGQKKAPVLTIFVGGNHEPMRFLNQFIYGGWLAPNIYYLGHANCIRVNDHLRIAGISGIYNYHSYYRGHFERPPYDENSLRSLYHTRKFDVDKLLALSHFSTKVDVFLSHDWPKGVEHHGNINYLLRRKPFFKRDIDSGRLGNPHTRTILNTLWPTFWYASHLHVKYTAEIRATKEVSKSLPQTTNFLALDKCENNKQFFETQTFDDLDISKDNIQLTYDPEWLAITKTFNIYFPTHSANRSFENIEDLPEKLDKNLEWVKTRITEQQQQEKEEPINLKIPTPPSEFESPNVSVDSEPFFANQTSEFCKLLDIDDQSLLLVTPNVSKSIQTQTLPPDYAGKESALSAAVSTQEREQGEKGEEFKEEEEGTTYTGSEASENTQEVAAELAARKRKRDI